MEKLQSAQEGIPNMSGQELKEMSEELAEAVGSLPNAGRKSYKLDSVF